MSSLFCDIRVAASAEYAYSNTKVGDLVLNLNNSNKLAIDIYNVSLNSAGITNTSNFLFKDYSNLNFTNSNNFNNRIIN